MPLAATVVFGSFLPFVLSFTALKHLPATAAGIVASSEVIFAFLVAWLWLGEHGDLGPLTAPQTFYQEIGTDVLPIELERIGARVHGRMRQAPLRLLDPLGNVDPLAKALGLQFQ